MGRKTKYCLNYDFETSRHLNDGKSPSTCYCSKCYDTMKKRIDTIQKEGGPVQGLRALRTLAGGSFGYETSEAEKARNLMGFFHYVMPHIPAERARQIAKDIARNSRKAELESYDGYKSVEMY